MLSGKQRAALRSLAQELEPILYIGKEGITENIVKQADDVLEARELIKGSVQQNCPLSAREACDELAERTHSDGVSVVGRKFVLYRESKTKKKIEI